MPATSQERARRLLVEAELADRSQWRTRLGARRQLGRRSRSSSRRRSRARQPPTARPCRTPRCSRATRDSVRAIMMIRAFRMRGHLHANLDPLGIAKPIEDYNELSPATYGFTEADYDRKIFIDNVLGLEYATIRADAGDPEADLLLDARRRVHAHLRSGGEGLDSGAHRRAGQGHQPSRPKARRRSCRS